MRGYKARHHHHSGEPAAIDISRSLVAIEPKGSHTLKTADNLPLKPARDIGQVARKALQETCTSMQQGLGSRRGRRLQAQLHPGETRLAILNRWEIERIAEQTDKSPVDIARPLVTKLTAKPQAPKLAFAANEIARVTIHKEGKIPVVMLEPTPEIIDTQELQRTQKELATGIATGEFLGEELTIARGNYQHVLGELELGKKISYLRKQRQTCEDFQGDTGVLPYAPVPGAEYDHHAFLDALPVNRARVGFVIGTLPHLKGFGGAQVIDEVIGLTQEAINDALAQEEIPGYTLNPATTFQFTRHDTPILAGGLGRVEAQPEWKPPIRQL